MYRGFNLKVDLKETTNSEFYKSGKKIFDENAVKVKEAIETFVLNEGTLNGTEMQSTWFPQIKSNVFISHSHKDQNKAIILSGFLYQTFGIKSFVDSCVWGYADDLLKKIDDKFCYQKESETYNYNLRNYSTSHIHMMLSTALAMMIDNSECLFFFNTPNSISTHDIIDNTESPWIYAELAMTQMIRKKIPERRKMKEIKFFSRGGLINESLRIQYDVNLSHLTNIDFDTLTKWDEMFTGANANDALDSLYDLCPIDALI